MKRIFLVCLFTLATAALAPAAPATRPAGPQLKPELMEEIDGRKLPKNQQWPASDTTQRFRPWTLPADHRSTLVIENLKIHHVTNQKAIFLSYSSPDKPSGTPGEVSTFAKVIFRNVEISDVSRDEAGQAKGLHMDFILVNEARPVPFKPELVLEDVYLHDGDAIPLLVKDGVWSRVTLRRVKVENITTSIRIDAWGDSSIDEVLIEDCPDLRVSMSGDKGRIGKCIVRNSPGAQVSNTRDSKGSTPEAPIIIEDTPATAPAAAQTPKPATQPDAKSLQQQLEALDAKLKQVEAEMADLKKKMAATKP